MVVPGLGARRSAPSPTYKNEIAVDRTAEAGDLDLEVGNAVAVDVALQQAAGEAELAGGARESSLADQVEGLVAAGGRIGVDVLQVDPVVFGMLEALDEVVLGAHPALGHLVEIEGVGTGAAELHVPAEAADQQVVAVLALEQVLAAFAEQLVVAGPALDMVEAGPAADRIVSAEPVDQVVAVEAEDLLVDIVGRDLIVAGRAVDVVIGELEDASPDTVGIGVFPGSGEAVLVAPGDETSGRWRGRWRCPDRTGRCPGRRC